MVDSDSAQERIASVTVVDNSTKGGIATLCYSKNVPVECSVLGARPRNRGNESLEIPVKAKGSSAMKFEASQAGVVDGVGG